MGEVSCASKLNWAQPNDEKKTKQRTTHPSRRMPDGIVLQRYVLQVFGALSAIRIP